MVVGTTCRLIALLPVLAALVSGCGRNSTPDQVLKIVIGAEPVPHSSPVWIAEAKGYFQQEGVTVEVREFESGRTALRTMLNVEGIDIATAAQTPVISHSFDRNDYAIIGGMVYSDNDLKMLARRDRGIAAPSDLRGKTVGMTGGSSGHFFLALFLALHDMQLTDLKTVDIEATNLARALVEGEVDAIATWEPHIYRARKELGEKALLLPSGDIYREDFYFVARKDFIRKNTEALKRFLQAIKRGEEFISKNGQESKGIVAARLKMDREILDATWDDFHFRLFLDQAILTSLEDESRWAINNRLTTAKKVPNYLDFIHTDALIEIDLRAVTVAGK